MGTWGTGFYSDDETLDVKDTTGMRSGAISFGSPLRSFSGNTVICPRSAGKRLWRFSPPV